MRIGGGGHHHEPHGPQERHKNVYVFWAFLCMAVCFVGIYVSKFFWPSIAFTCTFLVGGWAVVGLTLAIYLPYRLGAAGRSRAGWASVSEEATLEEET